MKVVAIVGMAGAGKSEVARVFEEYGYKKVRFGDITDAELQRRRLESNEENERNIRQQLRKEHGMTAYSKLNLPRIDSSLKSSNVVIDGLYSWEEYLIEGTLWQAIHHSCRLGFASNQARKACSTSKKAVKSG